MANAIGSAKLFIGNQSCPMAIALGLGKNVIQEVWPLNGNCILNRANAVYWKSGGCPHIPDDWLA